MEDEFELPDPGLRFIIITLRDDEPADVDLGDVGLLEAQQIFGMTAEVLDMACPRPTISRDGEIVFDLNEIQIISWDDDDSA